MADLQLPEAPINGAASTAPADSAAAALAAAAGAAASAVGGETLVPGSKRQRRPSVRLGDIGEQSAAITSEPHLRRGKQWKISSSLVGDYPRHLLPSKDPSKTPSKTRPVTILGSDDPRDAPDPPLPSSSSGAAAEDRVVLPVDEIPEPVGVAIRRGVRDAKARRAVARRVRSAWTSKVDEGTDAADLKSSGGEDAGDEGYREFDDFRGEDSESPRAAAVATPSSLSLSEKRSSDRRFLRH